MSRPLDQWPPRALLAGFAGALLVTGCGGGGGDHRAPAAGPSATPATAPTPPSMPANARRTATLNWTPVHRSTDGTELTHLAGYQIYGRSSRGLSVEARTPASVTSYQFTNLSPGTWYFTVGAYTADGIKGSRSNLASKTIP